MKDLILTKADTSLIGTLRVDMLTDSPANFTIMEIRNASNVVVDELQLVAGFYKKLSNSWPAFLAYCTTNLITVTTRESNGSGVASTILVPGIKYPIVSITSGTKTIVVATDITALFSAGNKIVIYNPDNTVVGVYTHVSDSYGAPNTSLVVSEAIATVAGGSGKYMVKG